MPSLKQLADRWEALAQDDALWAICADPAKRDGRWNQREFFAAGEREIATVFAYLHSLDLRVNGELPALDFGCGAGRLTRALAGRFSECWGVDISATMIAKALAMNSDQPRCKFQLNPEAHLRMFADAKFGFAYSSLVLQHIDGKFIPGYLRELARVLRPGGVLVFQMADHFKASALHKVRLTIGVRRKWEEMKKGRKATILMHCLQESRVREILAGSGAEIRNVQITNSTDPAFNGNLQYLDHEPAEGYVSKQYCVERASKILSSHEGCTRRG
jgi:ubiquinone/menaquinone biosynthesis C-methylase UbiE